MSKKYFLSVFILIFVSGVIAGTYTEQVDSGVYKKKAWSGDWNGCTTATVSCDSDQYLVGEEKYGTTDEYSDYQCRPQWYQDFRGDNSCTSNSVDDDWLGLEKERSKSSAVKGGSVSKTQCGANSGGGDEARAGVTALCYEASAFDDAICDSRGPINQCISDQSHSISGQSFNISSIFESRETATFEASDGVATLNLTNSSRISGFWRGAFEIRAERPRLVSGASFRPENGRIKIGK